MTDKALLRREMRTRLGAQSQSDKTRASENICARLQKLPFEFHRVAVFLATPREPNIDDFIHHLQSKNIRVFAPTENKMEKPFCEIAPDWSNLQIGANGYRTPSEYSLYKRCAASEMDFIILPGLAFDATGARLGQGGGWYDRALQGLPEGVVCVGVCFDFQVVKSVPCEEHDQSVSIIVTNKRILHV